MIRHVARADGVYEVTIDSLNRVTERLVSQSADVMDEILAPYVTWEPRRPQTLLTRIRRRIDYRRTMIAQRLHDALFGDGYHCRDCW